MLRFQTSLLLVVCTASACTPGAAARASLSYTPAIVASSQLLGRLDAETRLDLRIVLPWRNGAELNNFLEAVNDPQSPDFQNFLTPEQFHARFHPTDEQVAQTVVALKARGIDAVPQAGAILQASGRVADIETLFSTQLQRYRAPDGSEFFAPGQDVQMPTDVPIAAVTGLHNGGWGRTGGSHVSYANANAAQAQTVTPAFVHSLYNIPQALDGSGQTLAVLAFGPFSASDVALYEKSFNLPSPPIKTILVDGGFTGTGDTLEASTDMQMMVATAPQVSQLVMYQAPSNSSFVTVQQDAFNRIANPAAGESLVYFISTSWYIQEHYTTAGALMGQQMALQQMVAQGQTLFACSGDQGATINGGAVSSSNPLSVTNPSGEPYVISVGGTEIFGNNGVYDHETTWNDQPTTNTDSSSAGGVSAFWAIPSYQAGVLGAGSGGSTTQRNVPDVSLDGASGSPYSCAYQGSITGCYGTSFGTPTWTAFYALVQQARVQRGLQPLGFMAPYVYRLGNSSQYSQVFNDIADNSNNSYYPAVKGFDDATGWGTFKGAGMIDALSRGMVRRTFVAPASLKPGAP